MGPSWGPTADPVVTGRCQRNRPPPYEDRSENEKPRLSTADHALAALASAQVEEVILLGRRGPAQAAFTNPELRKLGELSRAAPVVDPVELDLDEHSRAWLEIGAEPTAKRNYELLCTHAERPLGDGSHRITLRFLRSPVELLGEGEDGHVTGMRIVQKCRLTRAVA